jgi:GNAT superfamily N-acetyltransferase
LGLSVPLSLPAPLIDNHQLDDFSSGEISLDLWLKRRSRANQASGASRTFIVCDGNRVIAYYALASGSLSLDNASGKFRRNMPDPVPVVVLARLAVDRAYQGQGIGRALFRDCALRVLYAADVIGIRGLIVHSISETARNFYINLGLNPSPREPMLLMVTLSELRAEFK